MSKYKVNVSTAKQMHCHFCAMPYSGILYAIGEIEKCFRMEDILYNFNLLLLTNRILLCYSFRVDMQLIYNVIIQRKA